MTHKRVVIIGGGFGGLAVAKKLRRNREVEIDIIDRNNYHLFQPLLYQVASSALSPADIAYPIRTIFRRDPNVQVFLGNVTNLDLQAATVAFDYGELHYDYLVIATGAKQSYFGRDEWKANAPGLKTIEDAIEIRRRILLAFEAAEYEADPEMRAARLTFVIVGGGPTGVELAGAIKEIAMETVRSDFKNIDTSATRVVLIEGNERLLAAMAPELSAKAKKQLEHLGVEVKVSTRVTEVSETGVTTADGKLSSSNVFWAAGVQASSLAARIGVPCDRAGRALVNPDFSIPNHPNIFVIGDAALNIDQVTKEPVPGVAQGAIQAGQYVARLIQREIESVAHEKIQRTPFHYSDKGSMATIGRAHAVAQIGPIKIGGFIAWLLWSLIHVLVLVGFKNRLSVLLSWFWSYVMFNRGARLITGSSAIHLKNFREEFKR